MRPSFRLALIAGVAALLAIAQDTVNFGRVRVADERQSLDRGRLGSQESMPVNPLTLHGMLVDGGCRNRTTLNLAQAPVPVQAQQPAEYQSPATKTSQPPTNEGSIAAYGINVDGQTLGREREDILPQHVADMLSRMADPTCSINAATVGFGFLMNTGRLLDLDEGGNTFAWQAVQSSGAGKAMLEGKGPGVKPKATIQGRIIGDQLIVDKLTLQ